MVGLREGRQKSVTPLSRVITSFHPIERHSIHPLSADTNSARQAGQRVWLDGGTGVGWCWGGEEGGMDGTVTRQQGEKKGKVAGEERGQTTPMHITLKSVSRLL